MSERIFVTVVSRRTTAPMPDVTETDDETEGTYSLAKFAAYQITKKVIATISSEANYYLGKYTELTEDYKTGVNINNVKTMLSTVGNIFGSALAGGIAGAKFGPVGLAIGAISGAVFSVTSSAISAKNTYNEAIASIHENVYSNYFYGEKAGYADGSRGTEN